MTTFVRNNLPQSEKDRFIQNFPMASFAYTLECDSIGRILKIITTDATIINYLNTNFSTAFTQS